MNMILMKLAGALLGLLIAVCTVYEFYLFFKRPLQFWRGKQNDLLRSIPFWSLPFGVGICIFHGTRLILSWMPRSWQLDDFRAPTWIAGFAAFFGAFAFVSEMEKLNLT
jgi:hypothetical protein